MDSPRMLKRDVAMPKESSCHTMTAELATELLNAASSFHKLHLKIKGSGSYAAHKALNELYDALPDHADTLIEGYQGASEMLLSYTETSPKILNTVEEAIVYLRELYNKVNMLQSKMSYSEIINSLDTLKDSINVAKYKLIFLK
jgi:DNA-binding ferritin-like protein